MIGGVNPRFPALRHRQFRRYFIGQSIAMTGGFASNVAMAWLAYRMTGSVALLGVLGFAQMAPSIVVSPIAGLLGDRGSRRRLLMGVLATVALIGLVLAALTATDRITPGLLLALAALRGVAFACEIPLRNALVGDLVQDRAVLPNAVALHSTALNSARFLGPAIGGVLIGAWGEAACFLLHPITLVAVLVQLARIRTTGPAAAEPARGSFLHSYVEGWRYALSNPTIGPMLLGVFALGFGVSPYTHLMPAAVSARFGAHPELVGLFLSAAGIAALAGALTMAAGGVRRSYTRLALAGNVAAAAGLALFALTASLPAAVFGMVLVGLGTNVQAMSTNITIQLTVPENRRAQVMSIYTAMFIGATPLGSLFFGWVGQAVGAPGALLAGAALAAAGALLTVARRRASA